MTGTTFTVEAAPDTAFGPYSTFEDAAKIASYEAELRDERPHPQIRERWADQERVWYAVDPERGIWQATTARGITTTSAP